MNTKKVTKRKQPAGKKTKAIATISKMEDEAPTPVEKSSDENIVPAVSVGKKETLKTKAQLKEAVEYPETEPIEDVPVKKLRGKGKMAVVNLEPLGEIQVQKSKAVGKKTDKTAGTQVKQSKAKTASVSAAETSKGKKKAGKNEASSSTSTPAPKPKNRSILQLKISLRYIEPEIWRRIQVLNTDNFADLHSNIKAAMGWNSSHLHHFVARKSKKSDAVVYIKASHDFSFEIEDVSNLLKDRDVKLSKYLSAVGDSVMYLYDFGDSWEHDVVVEKILPPPPPKASYPKCLAGKRACPPEDCGGVDGYSHLLEAIKNSEHAEHRHFRDWLHDACPGFDPEKFSKKGIFRRVWMWVGPGMEGY